MEDRCGGMGKEVFSCSERKRGEQGHIANYSVEFCRISLIFPRLL